MAALSRWKLPTENLAAKLLSLAIASVFWLAVTADREIRRSYTLPVSVINVPPDLTVSGNMPKNIRISVSGPEIVFLTHNFNDLKLTLDMLETGEGTVSFPDLQKYVDLPSGMQIVKIYPSTMELKLVRKVN